MIAETEAAAVELRDKAAACAKMAEEFDAETAALRAMLERAEKRATSKAMREVVLTDPARPVNTSGNTQMQKDQRVAISRSKRRKGDGISAAINKAGLSKNDVARTIGCTPAALSRYISGDRKIPKDRAEAIEKATKGLVAVSAWKNLASDDA